MSGGGGLEKESEGGCFWKCNGVSELERNTRAGVASYKWASGAGGVAGTPRTRHRVYTTAFTRSTTRTGSASAMTVVGLTRSSILRCEASSLRNCSVLTSTFATVS